MDFDFCAFFVCFRFLWSGLLFTAELRFLDRFFGSCSYVVGMCSCKARRFAEALRSSWILTFALFLFASAFCGLVYCSPQSCGFRTGFLVRVPTSWECVLAKQEGSLKLCALLGFSLLRFFCLLPLFFWSGLLCTAELRFSDRFFGSRSHVVGMCSCKARRFAEALRSSWILTFALFLSASGFFWSGLLCTASCGFLVRVSTSCECVLAKQEGSLKL